MQAGGAVVEKGYIASLDGLRAVSITVVFLAHAGVSQLIPGGFGVTVFFFLSGYLITSLLAREWASFGSIALPEFYLRRLIRLGPPVAITLLLSVLAASAGWVGGQLDLGAILSQIFFIYNYYALYTGAGSVDGLGILWSLAVEEQFYFVWPAAMIALCRGWIGTRHIAFALAFLLAWRLVRFLLLGADEWTVYIATDTRLDSLLYGCLLALWERDGTASRVFRGRMEWYLAAAAALLLASFLIRDETFRSTLRYSLQGIALMPVFFFAISRPQHWLFRPLNWAPVRMLGVLSYTIYLVHYVILSALEQNGLGSPGSMSFVATAAILSIAYASAMYLLIERPLQSMRKRLNRSTAIAVKEAT